MLPEQALEKAKELLKFRETGAHVSAMELWPILKALVELLEKKNDAPA